MLPVGPERPEWTVGFPAVKRVLLALVPALILTGALAACGGDDSGGSAATTSGGGSATTGGGASADQVAAGKALARDRGCTTCHSSSGSKGTGPTWKGLYGSEVKLADGTTVTADETYLKESITDPSAKLVDGYGNLMPQFNLTPAEQDQIVAYIKSLA
jgi:cytochrome c oxidase subunit 2